MKIPVLTAAAGAAWEAQWVKAFERDAHPVAVSRRCVDILDLLAVAAGGHGRAALVAADARHFDADAVDRLRAAQVVPVAVVERGDSSAVERLGAHGVRYTVPADADPAVVASVVLAALSARREPGDSRRWFSGAAGPEVESDGATASPRPDLPRPGGRVVAVWGPAGAPGRTTVATGLADEVARLGPTTLLIDADVYGGSIAPVLGLLDESPGLAAACRAAATGPMDAATLATWCWQLRPSLRVLTGIPFARRWPEIRPSAIAPVIAAARALADWTVIDCAFSVETDEELSYDTLTPRRNGATLALLAAADLVVVVGSAEPVGIQRVIRGMDDLRDAGVTARGHLVINRARPAVSAGEPAGDVTAVLSRLAGRRPDCVLPYDRAGLDVAMASGRLLSEVRPTSPLRRGLTALASAVCGIAAPAARHRR